MPTPAELLVNIVTQVSKINNRLETDVDFRLWISESGTRVELRLATEPNSVYSFSNLQTMSDWLDAVVVNKRALKRGLGLMEKERLLERRQRDQDEIDRIDAEGV